MAEFDKTKLDKTMRNRTRAEKLKCLSWGAVTGAIALAVVTFSAGWVVSAGTMDKEVRLAWIDGQASACTALVSAHRESTGDVADLTGFDGRDARDALATAFAVVLPGEETANADVIRACSTMLNQPQA